MPDDEELEEGTISWLDEAQDKHDSAEILDAEDCSFINFKSAYLKTFLADEKNVPADDSILHGVKDKGNKQAETMVYDDNDFSMDFD